MVSKRYSVSDEDYKDNFVAGLFTVSEQGEKFKSTLYSQGGMSREQMRAICMLLNGAEIMAPVGPYYIRLAKA